MEHVKQWARAREILGEDGDDSALEFLAWLEGNGLWGSISRRVNNDGEMVWELQIRTLRGTVSCDLERPTAWRDGLARLGL